MHGKLRLMDRDVFLVFVRLKKKIGRAALETLQPVSIQQEPGEWRLVVECDLRG